ncbi:MAG: SDR family NAD(P)-dependent oxidoreductase [Nitrososphaerota archaeon]
MMDLKRMDGVKVLITGGLGFIGSNLAHKLVSLGAEVKIYDALLEGYGANLANIREIKDKVEVIIGDIREYKKLKEVIKDSDVVFHCAAQVSRIDSMSNPWLDININCVGTINVLEAVKESSKETKVIYTSSRAVAGLAKKLPVDEETPPNPVDIYGADKHVAEMYCKIYHRAYGLKTTILRLTNCYGPRAQMKTPRYGVINWFIKMALENKILTVYHPGTMLRDYVYVDDAIDALILAAQNNEAVNEIFYVTSGNPITLVELANMIVRIANGGEVKIVKSQKEWELIEIGDFYATYDKIKKKLGWYPKTDIETGLRETIQFYKERWSDYLL